MLKKIIEAEQYKKFQKLYGDGLKLINDKKYLEAIQKFSFIDQSGAVIYKNAQSKILECRKYIINGYVDAANTSIKGKNYSTANKYIEVRF